MSRRLALVSTVLLYLCSTADAQCVWGSFDASRINYSGGILTTGNHKGLRSIITSNGGSLAKATPSLTATYLAGINVFYTSLLKKGQSLSAAEKTALQNWVTAGGTVVATGDIYSLPFYNGFTQSFGVTFGKTGSKCGAVTPTVTTHALTQGVTKYYYCTNGIFVHGTNATRLGNDVAANPFLAVVDATATVRGRLVVTGDHNMFTDSMIGREKNTQLATNIVKWACKGCSASASWANYGTGWAGRLGIPTLVSSANPVHGASITLIGSSTAGLTATPGLLIVGLKQTSVPFLGGTLLASLDLLVNLSVPNTGLAIAVKVPTDPSLCGVSAYTQVLQRDAAASLGLSFTRGLRLTIGK